MEELMYLMQILKELKRVNQQLEELREEGKAEKIFYLEEDDE